MIIHGDEDVMVASCDGRYILLTDWIPRSVEEIASMLASEQDAMYSAIFPLPMNMVRNLENLGLVVDHHVMVIANGLSCVCGMEHKAYHLHLGALYQIVHACPPNLRIVSCGSDRFAQKKDIKLLMMEWKNNNYSDRPLVVPWKEEG